MAVSDFLSELGKGVEATGRVVGSIAKPLAERTAEVVSGDAPQLDEEKRQRQYQMEDQQIEVKAKQLEDQLAIGQKYGTLDPAAQQQYVDQISQLYSHPRHAATLMEKLRQTIHPKGATYTQGSGLKTLKNAVPEGGTAAQDEANREKALVDALGMRQAATDEEIDRRAQDAAKYHKPAGKSPPVPGNQLPPDAIGPDGQPVSAQDRNAGKSFMEWNGAWYPAPKAKPVYKIIKGNVVLMDPATGLPQRNLGPSAGVKVSTHQTPFLGDDQQMHLLTLTTVTTPQGENIEVEPESGTTPQGEGGESKPPAPVQGKPAPKKVGGILPKVAGNGAKPGGVAGPVIPGSHMWAQTKNPVFKADTASYKKANDDAISKKEAFDNARKALASGSTASSDQELIYSWVRSNVQGAGRMTQAEFRQAASTGSLPLRAQSAWEKLKTGKLPPELEQMMFADIKRSYETAQKEADDLKAQLGQTGDAPSGDSDIDAIVQALKGKK